MLDRPIFLTGFMGAGKSRVGRLLARRLGRVFMDTDELVEARAGKPVARIFAEDGEERFRALEREAVATATRPDGVVSLGGGAIVDPRSFELVMETGILVWLDVDVETILQRLGRQDDRPLLSGLTPPQRRARVEALLAARAPVYGQAHLRVSSTGNRTPEETAQQLYLALEGWCAQHRRSPG